MISNELNAHAVINLETTVEVGDRLEIVFENLGIQIMSISFESLLISF